VELRRYIQLIRRRWILVLVTTVIGAGVGYISTPRGSEYRTTAQLYVGSREIQQNPNLLYLEPGLNQVVATFADMIPSPVIAEKAVAAAGVPRSAPSVAAETKATVVTGTNLIDVTVTDPDPVVAQKLANGISSVFVNQIAAYEPGSPAQPGAVPSEPAYIFQTAPFPSAPLSNGILRKVLLGAIFGFLVSVLLILLLDYLDITVKTADELERRLDLPVLAVIPLSSYVSQQASRG
jgi:capsular polysaccharide biosynthesis protein